MAGSLRELEEGMDEDKAQSIRWKETDQCDPKVWAQLSPRVGEREAMGAGTCRCLQEAP